MHENTSVKQFWRGKMISRNINKLCLKACAVWAKVECYVSNVFAKHVICDAYMADEMSQSDPGRELDIV